jgi:hypothetical protein
MTLSCIYLRQHHLGPTAAALTVAGTAPDSDLRQLLQEAEGLIETNAK